MFYKVATSNIILITSKLSHLPLFSDLTKSSVFAEFLVFLKPWSFQTWSSHCSRPSNLVPLQHSYICTTFFILTKCWLNQQNYKLGSLLIPLINKDELLQLLQGDASSRRAPSTPAGMVIPKPLYQVCSSTSVSSGPLSSFLPSDGRMGNEIHIILTGNEIHLGVSSCTRFSYNILYEILTCCLVILS